MTAFLPIAQAMDAAASAPKLLIALDFDGTLAPLVDNPDDARMTAPAREALVRLAGAHNTVVALVSGRGLANLRTVSEADPRWWLIGSHGIEVEGPANGDVVAVPTANPDDLQSLWDDFSEVAKKYEGTWVETKPWGAAMHTRGVDDSIEQQVQAEVREKIAPYGEALTTRLGHGIIESSLQSQTKADGLLALQGHVGPDVTVFAGDDRTDEDAMVVLGQSDIGIRVGEGPTAAPYFLESAYDMADFLTELASKR